MKTLKKITLTIAFTFGCFVLSAQQDAMYTHYMNNTLVANPGYAGSRDALTVTALHRSQWVDFKGAPVTQTLTMHTPLKNRHVGIGLSVLNDKIGPINNTAIAGDFAYILKLDDKSKLALGLSATLDILQANLTGIQLDDPNDAVFQGNVSNKLSPNFGFGAYYYRERFYAGLSVPNMLQNSISVTHTADGNTLAAKEQRHYFIIAGTMLRISDNVGFKPTTYIKVTPAAPIEADLTASFILMKKLLVGAMFRTGDSFGGLVGLDLTDQFHIGYSYDWSYGLQSFKYNKGSHEILLRYDFIFFDKKRVRSPRYF